jgi:hypothetical protein
MATLASPLSGLVGTDRSSSMAGSGPRSKASRTAGWAFSTAPASPVLSVFFEGNLRCAHKARSSLSLRSLISAISWSRSAAEGSDARTGLACRGLWIDPFGGLRLLLGVPSGRSLDHRRRFDQEIGCVQVVLAGNAHKGEQRVASSVAECSSHAVRRGRLLIVQTGQSEEIHSPDACAKRVVSWI